MAAHFNVRLVAIENVPFLELGDEQHGLLSRALYIFEIHGYSSATLWRVNDAELGGHTWRTRSWLLLHRSDLAPRLDPVVQPVMHHEPQGMRQCLLAVADVAHLVLDAQLVVEPIDARPGSCRLNWAAPLQPDTLVKVQAGTQDFCVMPQEGVADKVLVRSKDPRDPKCVTVKLKWLTLSDSTVVVRGLDSPCHTVRSSPDPPGNVLLHDTRFAPPVIRKAHEMELWMIQGRCTDQLAMMVDADISSKEIIHKAGKAVTGNMANYMALAVQRQSRLLRAAEHGCIAPSAESI